MTVLVQNNHDRQTYFGALQMLTGELVLADYPTANGDTTVAFMHQLGLRSKLEVGISIGAEQVTSGPRARQKAILHLPAAGIGRRPAAKGASVKEGDPAFIIRGWRCRLASLRQADPRGRRDAQMDRSLAPPHAGESQSRPCSGLPYGR